MRLIRFILSCPAERPVGNVHPGHAFYEGRAMVWIACLVLTCLPPVNWRLTEMVSFPRLACVQVFLDVVSKVVKQTGCSAVLPVSAMQTAPGKDGHVGLA